MPGKSPTGRAILGGEWTEGGPTPPAGQSLEGQGSSGVGVAERGGQMFLFLGDECPEDQTGPRQQDPGCTGLPAHSAG